ncbi:extracellular solute-binding protein [Thermoclostridium stercorarium]|uniref:extracellular solute-binding protein n=1 Tax=Thermoclostridium stercorarium TaxID=1510 RepID=UPI00224878C0|nr:extracellular solute-binding protein [Thermoclostridium stercorarium]UZQ85631.1 extracellular solute-binding protein [Thermoclostridium stercorarium]
MKKRTVALISVLMLLLMVLTACGNNTKPSTTPQNSVAPTKAEDQPKESELKQTNVVVLYSSASTTQNELVQRMWEERYPNVRLEIVSAGSGELQNRIIAEANNPQGDVIMGGSYAVYSALSDYLTPYVSPNVEDCIPEFRSTNDKFTAIQINVNTIMVNNQLLNELGVTVDGWESLTNPALKGKIIFADPSSSSSGREQLINMMTAMSPTGKPEDGWDFVKKFIENLDGKISSSSSAIYTGVANGEYAVGITNEEKVIEYMINGADVSPVYAKEGITLRTSYCGIIKGCKNEYNARLLVDLLTSKEYQQAAAEELYQRSVRSDVNFSLEGIPATTELVSIEYPTDWVEENSDLIKEKFQELWTSAQ